MIHSITHNQSISYVHGWASDTSFWTPLKNHLPSQSSSLIDLAFFGVQPHIKNELQTDLLITHSLGALWALKNDIKPTHAMVIINGFQDFTAFVKEAVLDKMIKNIHRNPALQLQSFLKNAEMTIPQNANPNIENLQQGLNWLKSWTITNELKTLDCPVLVLAGAKDAICPISVLEDQWQGYALITHPQAGHALPQTHPQWCAHTIRNWLEGIRT